MPRDVKVPFIRECELYGADVTLVDGLITDAGRIAAETRQAARLVRRLDAQGAVPDRRQEDDGLRARRADRLADCRTGSSIRTGGGTGMVGMWKAFEELERIAGRRPVKRPRMVVVQAEKLRAGSSRFEQGAERSECGRTRATAADDSACRRRSRTFSSCGRVTREWRNRAVAVSDEQMIDAMREWAAG
jgi:threonine synthase